MQPHNEEQRGAPIFLIQVVLAGIGFVVVLLLFATVFVSSNGSGDDARPSFAAVAADSAPTPVAGPTTAVPTTTTTIANGRPVPDVTEFEVNEAILELVDWKIDFSRINHSDEEIPADFVIETRPAAGTIVAPGTSVLLIVSTGPE